MTMAFLEKAYKHIEAHTKQTKEKVSKLGNALLSRTRKHYKKAIMGVVGLATLTNIQGTAQAAPHAQVEKIPEGIETVAFDNGTKLQADGNETNISHRVDEQGHHIQFVSSGPQASYILKNTPKGIVKAFRDVSKTNLSVFIEDTTTNTTYAVPLERDGSVHLSKNHPLFLDGTQQFSYSVGSIREEVINGTPTKVKEVYSTSYGTVPPSAEAVEGLKELSRQNTNTATATPAPPTSETEHINKTSTAPKTPLESPTSEDNFPWKTILGITAGVGLATATILRQKQRKEQEIRESVIALSNQNEKETVDIPDEQEDVSTTTKQAKESLEKLDTLQQEIIQTLTGSELSSFRMELTKLYIRSRNAFAEVPTALLQVFETFKKIVTTISQLRTSLDTTALEEQTKATTQKRLDMFTSIACKVVVTLNDKILSEEGHEEDTLTSFTDYLTRTVGDLRQIEESLHKATQLIKEKERVERKTITFTKPTEEAIGETTTNPNIEESMQKNIKLLLGFLRAIHTAHSTDMERGKHLYKLFKNPIEKQIFALRDALPEHSRNPLGIRMFLQNFGYTPLNQSNISPEHLERIRHESLVTQRKLDQQHSGHILVAKDKSHCIDINLMQTVLFYRSAA